MGKYQGDPCIMNLWIHDGSKEMVSIYIDGYKVSNPISFQERDVAIQIYTAFAPIVHIGGLVLRSPLTEPGIKAQVGDFIVAIDGVPTNSREIGRASCRERV